MGSKQAKLLQFQLFGSYVMVTVLLWVFVGSKPPLTSDPGSGWLAVGISGIAVAACAYWVLVRMRFTGQVGDAPVVPEPATFQTNLLIALAFAELVTLVGIFIGHSSGGLPTALFTGTTFACMFLLVLPKMLSYWRLYESRG